jgi:hypothetical protein
MLRELAPDVPSRRSLSDGAVPLAGKLKTAALRLFNVATLCIDAGTVHHRHLLIMLAMPKTCIVLRCIVAPEQMTAVWIAGEIAECKKQLAEKDVFVFQTVADNASNMRAGARCVPSECALCSKRVRAVFHPGKCQLRTHPA